MASIAQCLYCFETLSAKLGHRKPLSLAQSELYWNAYCREELQHDNLDWNPEPEDAGLEQNVERAPDGEEEDDEELDSRPVKALKTSSYKHSQQVDLKVASTSPGHSASSSSTPSATSKASSMRTDSPASMSSSRSSLSLASQQVAGPSNARTPDLERYPMFITWNTLNRNKSTSLRGCIGTFESQLLAEGLKTYALTSALEDVRFSPISASELPSLECSVTLLTDFEPAPDPLSWEIGKHGLRIAFTYHSKRYGATYLPDVAREQGWTKTETLVSLMRKAGWSGRKDEWQKVGDLSVVRYQGLRAKVNYEAWRTWRDWVDDRVKGL